ncbi:MAG: transposase [Bacilli bacterium]|nr:transposase [Bacilli bacterium]
MFQWLFSTPFCELYCTLSQRDKERVAARLRLIWQAPDEKSARAMKAAFCQEYEKSFPKAVECLEEGF